MRAQAQQGADSVCGACDAKRADRRRVRWRGMRRDDEEKRGKPRTVHRLLYAARATRARHRSQPARPHVLARQQAAQHARTKTAKADDMVPPVLPLYTHA